MHSLQDLLDNALAVLNGCRMDKAGQFRQVQEAVQDEATPMASAAAAGILYSLGILPAQSSERDAWVHYLQSTQNPESGLCHQPGQHDWHCTAAVACALELFEARLPHPPHAVMEHSEPERLPDFLHSLNWSEHPKQSCSHISALFNILRLTEEAGPAWSNQLFGWVAKETDENTGLLRKECIAPVEVDGQWTLLPNFIATYYLLTAQIHSSHPHPMPWRLIDTGLEIMEYHSSLFCKDMGGRHLPWVYTLHRCRHLSPHRFEEIQQHLQHFSRRYLDFLRSRQNSAKFHDLHYLQWTLNTLAELQMALPGQFFSRRPLRSSLDRCVFLV